MDLEGNAPSPMAPSPPPRKISMVEKLRKERELVAQKWKSLDSFINCCEMDPSVEEATNNLFGPQYDHNCS